MERKKKRIIKETEGEGQRRGTERERIGVEEKSWR